MTVFAALALLASIPSPSDMRGPFPILSTPYLEDGSVDCESLARGVEWTGRWGCPGVIWCQSNDSIDLLTTAEKFRGFEACAQAAENLGITMTFGANGTNRMEMLEIAAEIERVADRHPKARIAMSSRPPDDVRTEAELEASWEALGQVARRPVILQTFCSDQTPTPSVEMLVRLAEKHPHAFGYIKEEAAGWSSNERMIRENSAKPAVKTVMAGWGGWQWLLQLRQCGCEGLVTERCAYAPILGCLWRLYENGERGLPLTEAYALYRLMIDQRNMPGGLRGYSLHHLVKAGVFKTTVSREYRNVRKTEGGDFGVGREWRLSTVELNDIQRRELDVLFAHMLEFTKEKTCVSFDFGDKSLAFGPMQVRCRDGKSARITAERLANDVVRVRVEAEEGTIEDVRPGAASAALSALWYGNGHYVRRPGALSLISNGHANATSYDGFDFENGVSVVMASTAPIGELYHDPATRRCGIAANEPTVFTFVAGTNGAAACAIRYRKLFPPRAAPGVKVKAGKFCIDLWNGTLREQARLLRTLHDDFGLGDDVFIYTHNWQRFGYDVGLPDVFPPNPKFGTADDLRDFLATARACGWYAGVHLNTIDAYESAPSFDERVLCRDADGNRVKAWYNAFARIQSYRVRPDRQAESVRAQLKSMNDGGCACDTVFVDVIGSLPEAASGPWYDVDGKRHSCASVKRGYGEVFDAIRALQDRATGRPTFTSSEAAHDYLMGHLDGGDCQWLELGHEPGEYVWYPIAEYGRAVKVPWFDLVNHRAFSLHGAGYSIRYESGRGALFHGVDSDDYLCAEVLAGHPLMTDAYTRDVKNVSAGILVPLDFDRVTRQIARHYRLAQKTVNELAQAEIESLTFADGDPGRQVVRWSNGTTVWANRGIAEWPALPGVVLPQYGWFATNAVTGTMSAVRRRDGRVIEESFHFGEDGRPVRYFDARNRNRRDVEPLTPVATARMEGNRLAVDLAFERFRGKVPRAADVVATLWLVRRKRTENQRNLPDFRLGDFRGRLGDPVQASLSLPDGLEGAYDLLVSAVPAGDDVMRSEGRLKFLGTDSFYSRYHLGRVTVGRGFEPFVQPDRHLFERAFPE